NPRGGNQSGGGGGAAGGPPSTGPPPGQGFGRSLSEQQFSGAPPLGETRFLPEVVLQISNTIPFERVQQVARELGLTLIASQTFDAAGRVVYRFKLANGQDIRKLIPQLEQKYQFIASVQPNYKFHAVQTVAPPAEPNDVTGGLPPAPELQSDLANADVAARSAPLP